jgi:hypothetical protein
MDNFLGELVFQTKQQTLCFFNGGGRRHKRYIQGNGISDRRQIKYAFMAGEPYR